MSLHNLIQNRLSPDDMNQIDQHIAAIEAIIKNKLVGLTPEDRQRYGAINEQNKLFVNKVYDQMKTNPQHLATEIDWAKYEEDYKARYFLETRGSRLASVVYQMESTKMLHDSDNLDAGLGQYSYLEFRKKRGIPGATELHAELQPFFAKAPRKIVDPNLDTNIEE